jgi:hypothetical protein
MPLRHPDRPLYSGGILSPFQATAAGTLAMVSGDDYIRQLILTNLGDCSSENPFQQDLGIAVPNVFQNAGDPAWKARMRKRTETLFNQLHKDNLAKLKSISYRESEEEGAVVMTIIFKSLETATEQDLEVRFPS